MTRGIRTTQHDFGSGDAPMTKSSTTAAMPTDIGNFTKAATTNGAGVANSAPGIVGFYWKAKGV